VGSTPVGFGICRPCEGPTRPGFALCYCCTTLIGRLQMPLAPVTAVTPYRVGDGMHRLLRGYKDAPVAEVRSICTSQLAGILRRWLSEHVDRLLARTGGPWDLVVGVPSSQRPVAPVDALVDAVPLLARHHVSLLVRGPEPTDHLVASRRGFEVTSNGGAGCGERGRRALVVDDSFTTGARAQSAVAALRIAGIRVAGVLVVGRVIAPDAAWWQAAYWDSVIEERRASRTVEWAGGGPPVAGLRR